MYLITGAASGIGAAAAKLAASFGHRFVIADINETGARAVAESTGSSAMALTLDIRSKAEWDSALDAVWKRFGRLDVLVNNAAIVHTGYAGTCRSSNTSIRWTQTI